MDVRFRALAAPFLALALLSGCQSGAGAPAAPGTPGAARAAESAGDGATTGPTGVAGPTGVNTGAYLFDESYNFQPGFDVYQQDARLRDLFSSRGESELCWPTSLAQRVAEQKLWRAPSFPALQLAADPAAGDYTPQVRAFAQLCHTDPESGTGVLDALDCVRRFYGSSGYAHPWSYMIGPSAPDAPPGSALSDFRRPVSIEDIRRYASRDYGLIMEIQWYKFDPASSTWVKDNGHYFNVYGYDYYASWGEGMINLKVVNPNVDYSGSDARYKFNNVSMIRLEPRPGQTYPAGSSYILAGNGFSGVDKRAFVRNLLVFLPEDPAAR